APVSVYREGRARRPALLAAIRDPAGALTAVELVYLAPGGGPDRRLRLPRKTVGALPPGSAVRLGPAAHTLVVGEGVMSVLSACEALGQAGWALLSARNLAVWTPPSAVGRVLIAADRGGPGEAAAAALAARLRASALSASIRLPPGGCEDWNAYAVAQRRKEGG
ncbi:MAG: virulence-associated protein E, partial [Brevundimonas sp.]